MKKSAVDKYGPDFMTAINKGRILKRADGGSIGYGSINSSSNAAPDFSAITDKLSALIDKLPDQSKSSGKVDSFKGGDIATVAPTYNTTITVNVAQNGSTSENTESSSSTNAEDGKKLAELIKQTTLKTITEQQRNGGLLSKTR